MAPWIPYPLWRLYSTSIATYQFHTYAPSTHHLHIYTLSTQLHTIYIATHHLHCYTPSSYLQQCFDQAPSIYNLNGGLNSWQYWSGCVHLKLHLDVSISSLFSLSSSSFPLHPSLPSLLTCVFLFFFHQWGQLHQNKIYQNKHQPVAAFHLGSWASGGLSESLCELGHTSPRANMKLNWTNTHTLLGLATSPHLVSYKYSSSEWLPLSCLLQSASPFQVYGFEFAVMSEHSPQGPLQLYKSISGGTHRIVQGRPLRQRLVKDVTSFPQIPGTGLTGGSPTHQSISCFLRW